MEARGEGLAVAVMLHSRPRSMISVKLSAVPATDWSAQWTARAICRYVSMASFSTRSLRCAGSLHWSVYLRGSTRL